MIQPSSVDVRIDRFQPSSPQDPSSIPLEQPTTGWLRSSRMTSVLHPGEFVLASTYEVVAYLTMSRPALKAPS
jgi:deoxycytidine triphosphate deaminase